MSKLNVSLFLFLLVIGGGVTVNAADSNITIGEFRQLYDSLMSGKTLVTNTQEDGVSIKTERQFGQPINVGGEDFEVPIKTVITKSKDGATIQTININIIDRVNDLGGQPIIYEEARKMSVQNPNAAPLNTSEVEFLGLFRVSKNEMGGFDVANFGLVPSVLVENNTNKISGSNMLYSCFPEKNLTKCVLTVRDYKLGDYQPLVGYQLTEPIGGDLVETMVEEVQK